VADFIDPNEIFFTPFEPKLSNRFIMEIDGIPSFMVQSFARPTIEFEEIVIPHINTKRYVKGRPTWSDV